VSEDAVVAEILRRLRADGVMAGARRLGVSKAYVSQVLSGRRGTKPLGRANLIHKGITAWPDLALDYAMAARERARTDGNGHAA
jgi:DNA-binding transcriptional regulator YdaS (Cro superfamily)